MGDIPDDCNGNGFEFYPLIKNNNILMHVKVGEPIIKNFLSILWLS